MQASIRRNPFKLLLNIPVPWVFVLIFIIGVLLHNFFPLYSFSSNAVFTINIIGIILFVIGAAIASWSLFIFYKFKTTTTPGEKSIKLVTWDLIDSVVIRCM